MKKKISAALSAILLISTLSGCNNSQTDGKTDAPVEDLPIYQNWQDIDRDTVIAYVEGEDPEKFNITFGELYSEYLYYLLSYGVEDDMDPKYSEVCETYREDTITYLTFERVFLEVAEEKGCGISSLTEEDKAIIKENAETSKNNFLSGYKNIVKKELGENATEEEILNRSTEMLAADLARSELSMDIFEKWETKALVQDKLVALITADVEVTDEEVQAMFDEYVEMAKAALEADKLSYEMDDTLTMVYVPEGTRLADQILVAFDSETQTAIKEARSSGDDASADKIRTEAYNAEMQEKVNNIYSLIKSGSDFNELQATYNEDGTNDPYAVIPDSGLYVPEFTEAIFSVKNVGDVADPAVSDYGVHIIRYDGDEKVTEEEKTEIFASMKDFLIYQEETAINEAAYVEWMARYPYTIDYELIKVTPSETEEETVTE